MPEHYTPAGYSANATHFMEQRTAQTHAAFFLPYLYPGMKLLDCGCGPGTITLGLARAICLENGTVTAIDREASQIRIACENAKNQAISNVEFREGNIYNLPFPDNSFDAIFSHALFEHLQEPVQALQELWRVLKPEGKIGLRCPDWGGFLITPTTPELDKAMTYYKFLHQQNGGHPYAGRELRSWLRQAGFTLLKTSASYQCYEPLSLITEYLALRIEASQTIEQAVEKKWTDEPSISLMSSALREWSQHPDGWFAQSWCEVVGQKDQCV